MKQNINCIHLLNGVYCKKLKHSFFGKIFFGEYKDCIQLHNRDNYCKMKESLPKPRFKPTGFHIKGQGV